MNAFLRVPAWKIFFILVLSPLIVAVLLVPIALLIDNSTLWSFIPLMALLPAAITYYGWLWSAGVYLTKLRKSGPKDVSRFKIAFLTPLLFAFLITPALKAILGESFEGIILLSEVVPIAAAVYVIYLINRNLRRTETQQQIPLRHPLIDFLCIWILPIGIWFIQPRINRLDRPLLNNENNLIPSDEQQG